MKTYFISITEYPEGREFFGSSLRTDFAVFDVGEEFVNFVNGKRGFNVLDDMLILFEGERIYANYCILAENSVDAIDRAWDLKARADRKLEKKDRERLKKLSELCPEIWK